MQVPWREIAVMPVQWHALALGLFASIIAPFGGFFASGFKRAFKFKVLILFGIICWKYISPSKISLCLYIQDFGDSIPGHGGFTDRMDCQVCTFNLFCFQKGHTFGSGDFEWVKSIPERNF